MITLRPGKFAGVLAAALALALGWGHWLAEARAQTLHDPMQPPTFAAPASGVPGVAGGEPAAGALVLQSTLMSGGRRIAMIGGKSMKVGDRIGEAKIVAIEPGAVTLREGATTRVLELYQGVEITRPNAAHPGDTPKLTGPARRSKKGPE